MSPERNRRVLQRGIIILPSAFTLGNLFFGLFAMVSAARGDFLWAAWCIVFAAILDTLDGRIARFTSTGSRFGAELDSLVDAISFGVAPALLVYHLFLADQTWGWILSFLYVTAAVVRLARFNVEQGGGAKQFFHGLPSPTAGMLLATAYPFFTAPAVADILGGLPPVRTIGVGVIGVALLMVSPIPYPVVPRVGFSTPSARFWTVFLGISAILALVVPQYFIFPFLAYYTVQGVVRSFLHGLQDRLPDRDPLLDEPSLEEDEEEEEPRSLDYNEIVRPRRRREPPSPPSENAP
jgi:CDP-diacylglycerol---serine O-phosphatidyltransferase